MADRVGQQFGNYRLTSLLGRGGFAEVYQAEHTQLGMKAAIKILHAHLASEEISAFRQEARTIAALKHPHIIRVLDFDVQNGTPFLVLDYASKGSLRLIHPRGSKLPLDLVITYVEQIASALQYAHEHKLIHRDVKPENVLVGEDGHLLLSDFGIATIAHSTSSMATSATMGTLAYMAPEQIQGKPRPQSDQYALAVTVYQWLTGELLFVGSSAEIIAQHLGAPPPPLHTSLPDLPRDVEQVVLTALAKDPQQRFGSVQAFAKALALASSLPPESLPPSFVPPAQSTQSLSDTATQQARSAPVASGSKLSHASLAQLALTPPLPSSLTPSVQPERSRSASRPRITRALIGAFVLLLVIGSVFWFIWPGNGTEAFPYRLSASDSSVQHIGITLQQTSGFLQASTVTVNSLQIVGGQIQIALSFEGLEESRYLLSSSIGTTSPSSGHTRPGVYAPQVIDSSTFFDTVLTFPSQDKPPAGQECTLQITLYSEDSSEPSNYSADHYQTLYLQF